MAKTRKDNANRVLKEGESQRKDSTYMYRWTTAKGKRKCIYAKTLNELRNLEKDIKLEMLQGISRESNTLNYQIELYFELRKDLDIVTLENYKFYYEKHIKDYIGTMRVCNIKRTDVLSFYSECKERGLANGTICIIHKIVHPALRLAVDDGIIFKNPSDGCLNKYPVKKEVKYALTLEEEKEFLDRISLAPRTCRYYPFYAIMLKTGLRISEAIGLTWDDIDMENRVISINHQVSYRLINHEMVTFWKDKTKTESGMREFPMTDELYNLFCLQKKAFDAIKKDNSFTIDGHKNNFVFLSHQTGRIMYSAGVRRSINRIVDEGNKVREIQLPNITPHILRHTLCTRLFEAGVDFKTIQFLMGQADIETTIRTYNHVDKARAIRELEKLKIFTAS